MKFAIILFTEQMANGYFKHMSEILHEAPGGHREIGEDILETAKRELQKKQVLFGFDIIANMRLFRYG